ncbi:MAG TPA: 3-hydroxyacyl-CoA dehydrogenase [Burkholderiaceae bacterium]|nr:3-hydroxyacyl-CoA dehydrogenase [Burkholderiaceae bacterium]
MAALSTDTIVGVIGAGAMGAGIAQIAAQAGHRVLLADAQAPAVERAIGAIGKDLKALAAKGRIANADAILARIRPAAPVDCRDCGLVVEAIVEDLAVKRTLLRTLEDMVGPKAILATNTSSLSVTALAAGMKHPERVVGMHFFNPATRMKLVEVISGLETAPQTAETVFATAEAWGKKPAYAKSTPGFIVNRIARPFYGEAWRSYTEGAADPATIDAIVRDCGGFPMGPFELMDLIGHDVNLAVSTAVFEATFGERRYAPSLAQQELVRSGRLGRKSGRGIYEYGDGVARPAPRVEAGAEPVMRAVAVGSLGIATPVITRLESAGVDVVRVQGPRSAQEVSAGWLEIGPARLMMTDGRPATRRAMEERHEHLVLFDLALDYATTPRLGLARADQCGLAAFRTVCATLGQAGYACSPLDDVAGLVVMRLIAMLVNEAADAVAHGTCSVEAIDVAMRYGVNYPRGPMEWSEQVGLRVFARTLANLREHYGEERYRTSALITRKGYTGAGFHE